MTIKPKNAKTRANRVNTNKDVSPHLVACVKRIAELCQKQNIELILVTTPIRTSLYELLNENQLSQMRQISNDIAREYSNVGYYDFSCRDDFQHNDDYFYDADHLTDIGATYFTKLLNDTLTINSSFSYSK